VAEPWSACIHPGASRAGAALQTTKGRDGHRDPPCTPTAARAERRVGDGTVAQCRPPGDDTRLPPPPPVSPPPGILQVPVDSSGRGMGFGSVQVVDPAEAEAVVRKYHNTMLDGRPLFLRLDCDTIGRARQPASQSPPLNCLLLYPPTLLRSRACCPESFTRGMSAPESRGNHVCSYHHRFEHQILPSCRPSFSLIRVLCPCRRDHLDAVALSDSFNTNSRLIDLVWTAAPGAARAPATPAAAAVAAPLALYRPRQLPPGQLGPTLPPHRP
jgi:hypothetical protein